MYIYYTIQEMKKKNIYICKFLFKSSHWLLFFSSNNMDLLLRDCPLYLAKMIFLQKKLLFHFPRESEAPISSSPFFFFFFFCRKTQVNYTYASDSGECKKNYKMYQLYFSSERRHRHCQKKGGGVEANALGLIPHSSA